MTDKKKTESSAEKQTIHVQDFSTPFASMLGLMRTEADRLVDETVKNLERQSDESRRWLDEGVKLAEAQMNFSREMAHIWDTSMKKMVDATRR